MKIKMIDKLCCPMDKQNLKLTIVSKDIHGDVLEGFLYCNMCERVFPIVSGIPIMSPDEYRDFELEQPFLQRLAGNVSENFRLIGSNERAKPSLDCNP